MSQNRVSLIDNLGGDLDAHLGLIVLVDQRQLDGQRDFWVEFLDGHLQLVGDVLTLVQGAFSVGQTLASVLLGEWVLHVGGSECYIYHWFQALCVLGDYEANVGLDVAAPLEGAWEVGASRDLHVLGGWLTVAGQHLRLQGVGDAECGQDVNVGDECHCAICLLCQGTTVPR